ncbi:hypothetical protein [Streptomyces olivoreticuli]|nr:hypothetical protein [Streptomyces olivoreticuli]
MGVVPSWLLGWLLRPDTPPFALSDAQPMVRGKIREYVSLYRRAPGVR